MNENKHFFTTSLKFIPRTSLVTFAGINIHVQSKILSTYTFTS